MRVAWFSPLPPVHSGIAAYSLDALGGLAGTHVVHLFVDDDVWHAAGGHLHAGEGPRLAPLDGPLGLPLFRAFDFPTLHDRQPFDLIVYQLGNAACHGYMWPYLFRWPGLVVLHDGALHHARAQHLLRDRRADDYRAEFRYNHPGVDPRVADYVVAGLEGSPYYLWTMLRLVMERARGVVVHDRQLLAHLQATYPETPMTHVSMGVGPRLSPDVADGATAPRPGNRPQASPITFAAFGLITPEKRIPQILEALAAVRRRVPGVRLRLVGENAEHYALWQDVARASVGDSVEVTGYVDATQLDTELREADVCLCLRWPTAHETSASWLRCLAAGRPTIVTDLLTTVDVPTLDPRHWQLQHTRTDAASILQPPPSTTAVAVSIDMADEAHMLRQAMMRLAQDAPLRASLGRQAHAWWQAHHTIARMQRDYLRALAWAATLPTPPWPDAVPVHLRPDAAAHARDLIAPLGVSVDVLAQTPPAATPSETIPS